MTQTHPIIGPVLGMKAPEISRYSVLEYAEAQLRQDGETMAWYHRVNDSVARITGQSVRHGGTLFVPGDKTGAVQRRDLTTGVASGGGYLSSTQVGGFSAALYNASIIGALPIQRLSSLKMNVTLGAEAIKGAAGWVAESVNAPDAQPVFGQIAMTPHTVAARIVVSRQLQTQMGAAAEGFVMANLARLLGEAVDTGILHGTGASAQPTGLANVPGIDTRAGTSYTWADGLAMVKVSEGYSSSGIAAVAGVSAAETLRKRERAAGSGFIAEGSTFAGRPMLVTRAASAATLTVTDWTNVWLADWGALELQVDPFSYFQSGRIQIVARWMVDVSAERAGKVAYASAIT